MEPSIRAISWEAPEHNHFDKNGDWFMILAIIITALVVAAVLVGNTLFAVLIAVAGVTMAISTAKKPNIISFGVSVRGVRVGDRLYPYTTLKAYHIDEEGGNGPQLLILSKQRFVPLISLPLPVEYIDDVEDIMAGRIAEKYLEEPLLLKILEKFGF